eukprot:102086-Ditylum_brightwellii.AAC.1
MATNARTTTTTITNRTETATTITEIITTLSRARSTATSTQGVHATSSVRSWKRSVPTIRTEPETEMATTMAAKTTAMGTTTGQPTTTGQTITTTTMKKTTLSMEEGSAAIGNFRTVDVTRTEPTKITPQEMSRSWKRALTPI